jgi:ketosteroid isomerase-like protein
MSEQADELVRSGFSAVNRRDVLALLELCHDDIEWVPMRPSRAGTVYRGHSGVARAMDDLRDEFEELAHEPRDLTVVDDTVVVSGRLVAKERATGVRVDRAAGWLCTLRDDRLVRMQAFPDGDSALAAAGRSTAKTGK